jgi:hypothetical protein
MVAVPVDPSRLERALIGAAARYAPSLVPAGWAAPGDYARLTRSRDPLAALADGLAAEGTLPLLSTLPTDRAREAGAIYQAWASHYTQLYSVLAAALFPSYRDVQALFADQAFPPIVLIVGGAVPVTLALAAYAAPFTAARRMQNRPASEVELRGLLDLMLDDLEADDLPRDRYRALRDEGAALIKAILNEPVIPLALTTPAPAIRAEIASMNATAPLSTPPASTPPPPSLPEQDAARSSPVPPIFFDAGSAADRRTNRQRPPVPDLPPRRDERER